MKSRISMILALLLVGSTASAFADQQTGLGDLVRISVYEQKHGKPVLDKQYSVLDMREDSLVRPTPKSKEMTLRTLREIGIRVFAVTQGTSKFVETRGNRGGVVKVRLNRTVLKCAPGKADRASLAKHGLEVVNRMSGPYLRSIRNRAIK